MISPRYWLNKVYNHLSNIARGVKEMATFWTSIGVMLIPVGLAILIQWPEQYLWAFLAMGAGVILGIIGLGFTIKDEKQKAKEARQREKAREVEGKQREAQDKKRIESHYLDRLIQYQILKALGVNPKLVGRKYQRWLTDRKFQEELKKFEEEEGDEM
jgi:hypothetical protein